MTLGVGKHFRNKISQAQTIKQKVDAFKAPLKAQSIELVALDLWVVTLSPMLRVEIAQRKKNL